MMSMMIDWVSMKFLLLHAIAELYVGNGQREESDRYSDPKNVLHLLFLSLECRFQQSKSDPPVRG
jgi:hypothetical protein